LIWDRNDKIRHAAEAIPLVPYPRPSASDPSDSRGGGSHRMGADRHPAAI